MGLAAGDSSVVVATGNGGRAWSSVPLVGSGCALYSATFEDSLEGAMTGDSGAIFIVLQGQDPVRVSLPEVKPVYDLTYTTPETVIAAGSKGLFYRSVDSGKHWSKVTVPALAASHDFFGVDYFDDSTYWVVGTLGTVLYTEDAGTTWSRIPVPTTKDLYSINFPDSSGTGWIAGDHVLLVTTDAGDTWTSISTTASLRKVVGWDSMHAYAVGLSGAFLTTTDRIHWASIATGTSANLYGIDIPDSVFIVGDSGIVLTTLPPQADFLVGDQNLLPEVSFGTIKAGTDTTTSDAMIVNTSSVPVTITNIIITSPYFKLDSGADNRTPFILDGGGTHPLQITFAPPSSSVQQTYNATLRVSSQEAGERDVQLAGTATPSSSGVLRGDPDPLNYLTVWINGHATPIEYPGTWQGTVSVFLFNVTGQLIATFNEQGADLGRLPLGVYYCKIWSSFGYSIGKLVVHN